MKKELAAACLLAAFLAGALLHIRYLDRTADALCALVTDAENAALDGDWTRSETCADEASALWAARMPYLEIVLRHPELDAAGDALTEFAGALTDRDPARISGTAAMLRNRLRSLADMEKLRPGSIL